MPFVLLNSSAYIRMYGGNPIQAIAIVRGVAGRAPRESGDEGTYVVQTWSPSCGMSLLTISPSGPALVRATVPRFTSVTVEALAVFFSIIE